MRKKDGARSAFRQLAQRAGAVLVVEVPPLAENPLLDLDQTNVWHSEDDDRVYDEETDTYESIRECIIRKLRVAGEQLIELAKGL